MQPGQAGVALLDVQRVRTTEGGEDLDQHRHGGRTLTAREHHGEHLALVGEHGIRRAVDVPDLEQRHVVRPVRCVVGDGLEEARPERAAQDALLGHQGVGDGQPAAVQPRPLQVARGQERIGHRLADAQPVQHVAHLAPAGLHR
jgi:hypothetical protein